ncbi:perlucin isoform X3 [Magallana gigas]|uniref:perlucin isoform X3 n=1 Tax=Magallana gigas TaxID=29159 RepID=UPI003340E547
MASIIHAFICCWFLISANADIFSSMTYSTDKPSVPKKKSIFTPGKLNKDAVEKCPDGFVRFQDSCYNFYSEKFSWPEALIFCRAFNYTLVTLTTIDQYTFIKGHLTTITGGYISSGFWTAGTSADLQGHWKWVTNKQTIDFDQFNATDPTKSSFSGMLLSTNQQSGCLALEKSTGFNVARVDCMTPQHFICERHDSQ